MALYEPDARFVARSGEVLIGHERIREALGKLIGAQTQFRSRVVRAVTVADVAQLSTDFEGTATDDSGKTVAIRNKAIEVLSATARRRLETDHGRPQWTGIIRKKLPEDLWQLRTFDADANDEGAVRALYQQFMDSSAPASRRRCLQYPRRGDRSSSCSHGISINWSLLTVYGSRGT